MENHVSQQLSAYLTAAALGAASAMCYDLLRTVRLRRRNRRAAVRIFVLITSLQLLVPSLYGIHVLRADRARTVTAFYETYYETDSSFLVDLEASGLIGSL